MVGEGETPGGPLTPEEYRAAEGLDSAPPVSQQEMETEVLPKLEDEAAISLHDSVRLEADRMEAWASELLPDAKQPTPDRTEPPIDAERAGGMHQPVDAEPAMQDADAELRAERQGAMVTAFREGMKELATAQQESKAEMQAHPHTRQTLQEYFALVRGENAELANLATHIDSGQWVDPAVIRGKFTTAIHRIEEFTQSHPANS